MQATQAWERVIQARGRVIQAGPGTAEATVFAELAEAGFTVGRIGLGALYMLPAPSCPRGEGRIAAPKISR